LLNRFNSFFFRFFGHPSGFLKRFNETIQDAHRNKEIAMEMIHIAIYAKSFLEELSASTGAGHRRPALQRIARKPELRRAAGAGAALAGIALLAGLLLFAAR
jgi:phosphoribosylaminoimidazole-succinocarboxamide synthase